MNIQDHLLKENKSWRSYIPWFQYFMQICKETEQGGYDKSYLIQPCAQNRRLQIDASQVQSNDFQ